MNFLKQLSFLKSKIPFRLPKSDSGALSPASGVFRDLILFLIFSCIIAVFVFYVYDEIVRISDFSYRLFFKYGSNVLKGLVPYHDFFLEYPPFSLIFFTVPAYHRYLGAYGAAFSFLVYVFCLTGLYISALIGRKYNVPTVLTMGAYAVSVCAVGPILTNFYDVFPAVITMGAVYAYITKHRLTGWFLLSAAVLTKLYPIFLAPVFLIPYLIDMKPFLRSVMMSFSGVSSGIDPADKQKFMPALKKAGAGFAVFAVTGIIFTLPFVIIDADGFFAFLTYHVERGLHIETIYASIILLGRNFGIDILADTIRINNYGSPHLYGNVADIVAKAATPVMMCIYAVIYALYIRIIFRNNTHPTSEAWLSDPQNDRVFAMVSFLIVLFFMMAGKVFSTSYIIWLFPFIPFAFIREDPETRITVRNIGASAAGNILFPENILSRLPGCSEVALKDCADETIRKAFTVTFRYALIFFAVYVISCILSYLIYPHNYSPLLNFKTSSVLLVFIRNIFLLIMGLAAVVLCRTTDLRTCAARRYREKQFEEAQQEFRNISGKQNT